MDRRLALALALGLAAGCAKKAEEATRSAWEAALRAQGAGAGDPSGGAGDRDDRHNHDDEEWTAVTKLVEGIAETLAPGVATVDIEALAERLCGGAPDQQEDDGVAVYSCEPEPHLLIVGESLEIEVSAAGVVGIVAPDVNAEESQSLLQSALVRLKGACQRPFAPIDAGAENAHDEFYTCQLANGPTIAVGRFPRDLASNQWQFSLAVLGPG